MGKKILEVKELCASFYTQDGEVKAADHVSFSLEEGKTLCLVGESGCGKSITSLSILRLIPSPPGKIHKGEVLYQGKDLLKMDLRSLRSIRGKEISMIFQEPMTALNPVFSVGNQIAEVIALHEKPPSVELRSRTLELLRLVGISDPERRFHEFPHQLSGGMRQRVMIAMALACRPKVLIADEPTTALDVTIQAQILDLLKSLQSQFGMALILVTHDLGVVAEMADEVAVMYAGKVVEKADAKSIFSSPSHPYTRALLESLPKRGVNRLKAIPGMVPSLHSLPTGCSFQNRCPDVSESCRSQEIELKEVGKAGSSHLVRCVKV